MFFGREQELHTLANSAQRRGSIIAINGMGGVGKTALVKAFFERNSDRYSARFLRSTSPPTESFNSFSKQIDELYASRDFVDYVALDDADGLLPEQIAQVRSRLFNIKRTKSVFLISRTILQFPEAEQLHLAPLHKPEMFEVLKRITQENGLDETALGELVYLVNGLPGNLASIRNMLAHRSLEETLKLLQGQIHEPNRAFILPEPRLIEVARSQIIDTNQLLIDELKRHPQAIFEISPRRFEELLAELLCNKGYEVELTPQSSDGGRDLLAFLDTPHGRMLCLVEAKRYRRDRPIGVELIRQLFGTLVDEGANSAMMVTTSSFTSGAEAFSRKHQYKLALREYADVFSWIDEYSRK